MKYCVSIVVSFLFLTVSSFAQEIKVTQLKIGKSYDNVFASDYFKGYIYFCGAQKSSFAKNTTINEDNSKFLDLYKISYDTIKNIPEKEYFALDSNINSKVNEGPISINSNKRIAYFSSNTIDTTDDTNFLRIYESEYKNEQLQKKRLLDITLLAANMAHPTTNSSGDVLVFSSDIQSTKLGSNLYVSFLVDQIWSTPKMIENLNTDSIETFPHFYKNTLYFASSRPTSLGGLDIFKSNYSNGSFSEPKQLESPINSAADDFLYIPINEVSGIFSSNRNKNIDKIFTYSSKLPLPKKYIEIDDNFCFEFTDEVVLDQKKFIYRWELSDGTIYEGPTLNHCFLDTGIYNIRCHLTEKYNSKFEKEIISEQIHLNITTPFISVKKLNGEIEITMNNSYGDPAIDKVYWIINDEIITNEKIIMPSPNTELTVKMICWDSKTQKKLVGITKTISLN